MASLTISPQDEKRVKGLGFLSNKGTDNFSARVITRNGKITASQLKWIGEAAERFGDGNVCFTSRLTVEVPGIPFDQIEAFRTFIAQVGLETGGTGAKVRPIVSCKGTTCQYGKIDTFALSQAIHERFYEGFREVSLPHKFKIAVGGCPNNCVKPDLNDLGVVGQLVPNYASNLCRGCKKCAVESVCPVQAARLQDEKLKIDSDTCLNCGLCVSKCPFGAIPDGKKGYKIFLGGRWGKQVARGRAVDYIFTSEQDVMQVIEKVIYLYKENGKPRERFAQMLERVGLDTMEKELLSDL